MGEIAIDIETAPLRDRGWEQNHYFDSMRYVLAGMLWKHQLLPIAPKFVQIKYRKGKCFLYALALAFHLSYKDALAIVGCVSSTPCTGVTLAEVEDCIRYAEAIYNRRVTKIHWRGKLFEFCRQYHEGLFLVNCSGHIGMVYNGCIFGNKLKNYPVYNVWQIYMPDFKTQIADFISGAFSKSIHNKLNRVEQWIH